jgi:hypothetical protein
VSRSQLGRRAVLATLVVAGMLVTAAGCGGDDEPGTTAGGGGGEGTEVTTDPAPGVLEADITTVGSSLRISWRVTNAAEGDLVVFDNRRPDEPPGAERLGAFVTAGQGDATVEVARRLFPVPDDLEGVQAYGVTASALPAGATTEGQEMVPLPLAYTPAAPDGGGGPLPDRPARVVFCVGVAPAEDFPASRAPGVPEGYRFARHSPANVARQTLLCSDSFDLPAS